MILPPLTYINMCSENLDLTTFKTTIVLFSKLRSSCSKVCFLDVHSFLLKPIHPNIFFIEVLNKTRYYFLLGGNTTVRFWLLEGCNVSV